MEKIRADKLKRIFLEEVKNIQLEQEEGGADFGKFETGGKESGAPTKRRGGRTRAERERERLQRGRISWRGDPRKAITAYALTGERIKGETKSGITEPITFYFKRARSYLDDINLKTTFDDLDLRASFGKTITDMDAERASQIYSKVLEAIKNVVKNAAYTKTGDESLKEVEGEAHMGDDTYKVGSNALSELAAKMCLVASVGDINTDIQTVDQAIEEHKVCRNKVDEKVDGWEREFGGTQADDETEETGETGETEETGGTKGSQFAVPVFKKFTGEEQKEGAPVRSLSSQLMKLFPDVPKTAITQILKDITKHRFFLI